MKFSAKFTTTAALSLVLAALTTSVSAQDLDTSENITIGIGNEPPYTELKPDGSLSGAGPDLDRAILNEAGFSDYTGVSIAYGAMIPAVMAKRVRMLSSGSLIVTPERCQQLIFAEPLMCNSDAMLTKADAAEFSSYADLAKLGVKIGVTGGGIQQKRAVDAGVAPENIIAYPDTTSAIKMLQDGRIDAIVLNDAAVLDMKKRSGDDTLRTIIPMQDVPVTCGTAAFAKDDVALRDAYNAGLETVKANGELERILTAYGLESSMELLASAKTTAEYCAQ